MIWIADFPLRNRYILIITFILLLGIIFDQKFLRIPFIYQLTIIWFGILLIESSIHGVYIRKTSFTEQNVRHEVLYFFLPKDIRQSARILSSGIGGTLYSKEFLFKNHEWAYLPMIRTILETKDASQYKNILILGVGGGALLKQLHTQYPGATVTGVEKSRDCIKIAKQYFGLRESKNIHIIQQDAYQYLMKKQDHRYDIIVMDVFEGETIPKNFISKKYLQALCNNGEHIIINVGFSKNIEKIMAICQTQRPIFIYPDKRAVLLSTVKCT